MEFFFFFCISSILVVLHERRPAGSRFYGNVALPAKNGGRGRGSSTYINPDTLRIVGTLGGCAVDELRGYQAEHVLAATQKTLAGGIVDTGLRLVKTLECILLVGDLLLVRLQERSVKEAEERGQGTRVLVRLGIRGSSDKGGCKYDANEAN